MNKIWKYFILIVVVLISLFLFSALNSSTKAERTAEQKLFDDFSKSLNYLYLENTRLPEFAEDRSKLPTFKIELVLKTQEQSEKYNFLFDWHDRAVVKKGLRILELLSLANIFSRHTKTPQSRQNQISVTTSNGYSFRTSFDQSYNVENSSLALALVLIKN